MAARLEHSISAHTAADRTLCVTFTNRAARELRDRVEAILGDVARNAMVVTFHGLCAWILRSEAEDLGLSTDFVIYDEHDCEDVLGEIVQDTSADVWHELKARYSKPSQKEKIPALLQEILDSKSDAAPVRLPINATRPVFSDMGPMLRGVVAEYHRVLEQRNALDFADLVHRVRAMLHQDPEKAESWCRRFEWIQVDEVQDTHISEYDVIARLARGAGNLAFFGDLDQAIYGWRGAKPLDVLERFCHEFGAPYRFDLTTNHRSTKALLRAAAKFRATMKNHLTELDAENAVEEGEPITFKEFADPGEEARWIATQVKTFEGADGASGGRIAILARDRSRARCISAALAGEGIKHATVEQFEFFRRQEIKDCLARVRLITNADDLGALHRITLRPPMGVGEATLRHVGREGGSVHLRATDLAQLRTHLTGEPFAALLDAWHSDKVLILDVETTGLAPGRDEVVEVAAIRTGVSGREHLLHRYIRPSVPVGDSERIHGYSDAFLQEKGEDPAVAFEEVGSRLRDMHVVGHNVSFDLAMLLEHARNVGCELSVPAWDDTLSLSRRVIRSERYSLEALAATLGTELHDAHHALSDADFTAQLLGRIVTELAEGQLQRKALVTKYGGQFRDLARALARWREQSSKMQPADLLQAVLDESGLLVHYADEPHRLRNLHDLVSFFRVNDTLETPSLTGLRNVMSKVSLARNVDHVGPADRRPLVITVHQVKGMEFDTVFVTGLVEGTFPAHWAVQEGDLEEEERVFYVAITRPRKRLLLTSYERNEWGKARPSRFLQALR